MIRRKMFFKIAGFALLLLQLAKYLLTPYRIPEFEGGDPPLLAYIGYFIGYNLFLLIALVFFKKGFSFRRQA